MAEQNAQDLFSELLNKVKEEVAKFTQELSQLFHSSVKNSAQNALTDPANAQAIASFLRANQPPGKNIPWFKYGVPGFLRKLWYGNNPNNPDYHRESNLDSYLRIQDNVKEASTIILNEVVPNVSQEQFANLAPFVAKFERRVTNLIIQYLNMAKKRGFLTNKPTVTTKPTNTTPTTPTPTPKQEPAPVTPTIVEPDPTPPDVVTKPVQTGKKKSRYQFAYKTAKAKPKKKAKPIEAGPSPEDIDAILNGPKETVESNLPLTAEAQEVAKNMLSDVPLDVRTEYYRSLLRVGN
jgi:hypothetical protein